MRILQVKNGNNIFNQRTMTKKNIKAVVGIIIEKYLKVNTKLNIQNLFKRVVNFISLTLSSIVN